MVSAVAVLLLVPFIAMQFTTGVNWSVSDFVVAGVLLLGTGFACELVIRKIESKRVRAGILAAVILAAFLVWVELAVGIFGSAIAGN